MAKDKGKQKPVEEAVNPVDDGNTKPVEEAAEKHVEKAGRNDYILRLMESRRKAIAGEK